ncbi:ABC transporter substrate-binding protein [Pilosibacter fragilis]|uniref:ABC transporter substrate-binding protein n=1 Tax=Pilosibacter fragilis TaxID=3078042 RepID=UPI0032D276AE
MKKRFLCLTLTLCMVLMACGKGGDEKQNNAEPSLNSSAESKEAASVGVEKGPVQAIADEKVSSKDILVVAFDREPATLDPLGNNVTVKRMIEGGIFDTLLEFDENMKPSPCLAESWEQIDDLTWKFNLRQDVKFHNGDSLTSKDVKFSFLRVNNGTMGNDAAAKFDPDGYETPDDYTFILKTIEPWAFTEAQVCSEALGIVPEKVVTEVGDDAFGRAPIGSGAYKFVSWTAGDNITVERNDDYWRDKSILKTIKFRIITESASRTIDLESGGVDITLGLPTTDADRIDENPDTQLIVSTGATDRYIAFNCQKDVFKDKRVRQALNYATDKESIRVVCYGENTSETMDSVVPSTLPGHISTLKQYDYNIEKAKELLKEAGVENGFEVEFMYLANSTNNMLAELLRQMWSQVGVTLILKPTESGALTTSLNKGEQELCCAGTSYGLFEAGAGLYNMFHTERMYSGSARSNLSNPEVDKVLDEINITSDAEKRAVLVGTAQELIHEESPFIYIAFTKNIIGARSKVRGFVPTPTAMYDFRTVYFVE